VTAVLAGTLEAPAPRAGGSAGQPPAVRYPARPAEASWPATRQRRGQVMNLVDAASSALPESRVQASRRRGLPLLLDWLEGQPGQTWQDRWLASGADDARGQWAELPARWLRNRGLHSASRLELMTSSLLVLVGADVIRPSLAWLLTGGRKRKLARNMIQSRDPVAGAADRQAMRGQAATAVGQRPGQLTEQQRAIIARYSQLRSSGLLT
jgi:hypothetical protein